MTLMSAILLKGELGAWGESVHQCKLDARRAAQHVGLNDAYREIDQDTQSLLIKLS